MLTMIRMSLAKLAPQPNAIAARTPPANSADMHSPVYQLPAGTSSETEQCALQ